MKVRIRAATYQSQAMPANRYHYQQHPHNTQSICLPLRTPAHTCLKHTEFSVCGKKRGKKKKRQRDRQRQTDRQTETERLPAKKKKKTASNNSVHAANDL